jgi:hypothetical protein
MDRPNAVFEYPIHCHPEYEINLVIDTNGTRVIGDSEETFDGLDFVMVGPYIPHVWKAGNNENRVITIQFSREILNFEILNKRLFMPIKQLLLDSIHGLHFFGPEADSIQIDPVQYPDRKVVERCAMIRDFGDRTELVLEMWSRVKGDNLNTGIVLLIFAVFGLLLVWLVYKRIKEYKQRQRYRSRRRSRRW